uniref:Uncharacterized protein n=1 Tax=Phytophthora ramorum TaxID=164328 RepID=H3H8E2_PHYRM
RLESATDLGEILSAAVAPARLSLAESEEIISLRDEIARLQAQCADSEDRLHAEVQQREKIEVFCTQATSDSNQAMDTMRQLRLDHVALTRHHNAANAALGHHADIVADLSVRAKAAETSAAAAQRLIRKDRERFKAGLVAYTAQLAKLRSDLAAAAQASAGAVPAQLQALQEENASLKRANSVLRRRSAAHDLDVDTLVLASAARSSSSESSEDSPDAAMDSGGETKAPTEGRGAIVGSTRRLSTRFNTTFAPCNPQVPMFVPRGMTQAEVVSGLMVDPSLPSSSVTAPWAAQASVGGASGRPSQEGEDEDVSESSPSHSSVPAPADEPATAQGSDLDVLANIASTTEV